MSLGYPQWLMERVFGGTHVADTPGSIGISTTEHWPVGESPPASEEVCDLLLAACGDKKRAEGPIFVFLVGGAGNGKSFLAKKVASELNGSRVEKASKFSSRSYDYTLDSGAYLRIVNDATIPPRQPVEASKHLTNDVDFCIKKGAHLLACVNRGVLIAESQREPTDIAAKMVNSLLKLDVDSVDAESDEPMRHLYFRKDVQLSSGVVAQMHVVFMDQCSLFEPYPKVHLVSDVGYGEKIEITPHRLLPLVTKGSRSEALPGKTVISSLLEKLTDSLQNDASLVQGNELDPLRSNLVSLSNPTVLSGLCDLFRGAEIIAGERYSYRDVWGLATTALMGSVNHGDLSAHQQALQKRINNLEVAESKRKDERLRSVLALSQFRTHMALFPDRVSLSILQLDDRPARPNARALTTMAMADPLRSLSDDSLSLVQSKLALLDEYDGPGQSLADENTEFRCAWTGFDAYLERALLDWLYDDDNPPKLQQRNEVLSWYGQYLARLYALAYGQPAFSSLAVEYSEIWNLAAAGKGMPSRLEAALKDLLFSSYSDANDETFLPILSPRVNPVSEADIGGKLVLGLHHQEYFWSQHISQSGAILVELKAHRDQVALAKFTLDFPMLREALAHRERRGFTEQLLDVEPRIERARATMLGSEMRRARGDVAGSSLLRIKAVNNGVIL